MTIRIVLADDHAVVRDGLRLLLESEEDITVVGLAASGLECIDQVRQYLPDVVVMDIAMPGISGIEATRRIIESNPSIKVIILSMFSSHEHVFRALQVGAKGFVTKGSAGKEVVSAVRRVLTGQRYLGAEITENVIDEYMQFHTTKEDRSPLERLSPREAETLQLVAEGRSSHEIADLLNLSPKTVDSYRSRLMQKLGLKDITDLVKFAIQHGLTDLK